MINNGTNIIQFGTGNIIVSSGKVEIDENIPFLSFSQGSDGVVGRISTEGIETDEEGRLRDENAHTRLIFTSEDSIDVLIDHLNRCKQYINGSPLEAIKKEDAK